MLGDLNVRASQIDGYTWTVGSWINFEVTAELPLVTVPVLHMHVEGDELAGHTLVGTDG
jgi:hypothetical protein